MSKINWKPGNMIYPLPAVLVTCGNCKDNYNIITIAWTGTICTNPPMTYISVRPSRHSYNIIKESKEFVINLSCEKLVRAVDYCGVKSGKNIDKFKEMKLTIEKGREVEAPLIAESPVNIECKVKEIIKLGSHDMFMAEVVAVNADEKYLDNNNKFHLDKSNPICYSHGTYFGLGKKLGTFGYSVAKKSTKNKKLKKTIG
ncbi:flavin reductase family protein [Vallitalea sp.]|jgi:flavin reductase (DIM6/NTAB) family NADH-FMN oxidoreductase RutF|uniref:flavin reductase family protein n=1 Tax=Vallitalea sp. TaxID=1882829 RepID=UPI0025E6509A|nr:flavin reductase family protein [Vallitalea sp.]MCT4686814.1 flavin reductase family protein [Vallitalea sp.]